MKVRWNFCGKDKYFLENRPLRPHLCNVAKRVFTIATIVPPHVVNIVIFQKFVVIVYLINCYQSSANSSEEIVWIEFLGRFWGTQQTTPIWGYCLELSLAIRGRLDSTDERSYLLRMYLPLWLIIWQNFALLRITEVIGKFDIRINMITHKIVHWSFCHFISTYLSLNMPFPLFVSLLFLLKHISHLLPEPFSLFYNLPGPFNLSHHLPGFLNVSHYLPGPFNLYHHLPGSLIPRRVEPGYKYS